MRNRPFLQMALIGVVLLAVLLPVSLVAIPWFPTEASKQAGNVHTLYDVLLVACIPIFVIVATVIIFSVWKFHVRPGQENMDGPPIHGHTRLEVVWTIFPALLLLGMCSYAYVILRDNEAKQKGEMTVNVVERQFAFEFNYPEAGGKVVSSPLLYLPVGRPIVFKIRSLDVVHSFFVPEFSQKIDAVPGITTTLRVTPTRIGEYPAECTELCGPGHSLMRAAVRVVSKSQFAAWLSSQKPGGPPPIGSAGTPPGELPGG